jgi:N-sulfoglucosamine sulfohydrolase
MGDPYDGAGLSEPDALYQMGLSTTPAYRDLDGSLTKALMISRREKPNGKELFRLTMHPRPGEELYDLRMDPDQLVNLAADPELASVLTPLRGQVDQVMNTTGDPRLKEAFDRLPWVDSTKP